MSDEEAMKNRMCEVVRGLPPGALPTCVIFMLGEQIGFAPIIPEEAIIVEAKREICEMANQMHKGIPPMIKTL